MINYYLCSQVKKIFVILMLCSYFFSTTELSQLLKFPVLISHFVEHNENDNMGFWEYMSHHYGGHDRDADWDTDMKLPFMQHSDLLQLTVVTPKDIFTLQSKKIFISSKNKYSFYKDKFFPCSSLGAIWQPPKFC